MRRTLGPFLVSLVLAGCATVQAPVSTGPAAKESASDTLARVVTLVESATIESLTEAARLLAPATGESAGNAGSAPGAPALLAVGGHVFTRLYPELASPFPETPLSSDASGVSAFLGKVMPALDRLGPGTSVDQERAAALQMDLATADALNGASVLPPWLQALLELARGSAQAVVRPLLEEALRRDPLFYPAARELSAVIVAGGGAVAELSRLGQLADQMPTPALRFAALARAELAAGQPQKAADAAAQGLLAAPEDRAFVLLRAEALDALGDWYQALRVLDAGLKVQPDHAAALAMKARLLHEKERNDPEALQVLDDAEARFPGDASFPERRGMILLDMGRTDAGVEALKRALAIDPLRLAALSLLLRESAAAGQWSEAEAWLVRIPDTARGDDDLLMGWRVSEGLGSHDAAIAYARALGIRGARVLAIELETRSLIASRRSADALSAAERGLAAADTDAARSTMYVLRAAAGSPDPLSDLRLALLENPDNGEALSAIADTLAAQGEHRKAAEYAKRAAALDPRNPELASRAADLAAKAGSGQ